jgi:threonine synthase
VTESQWILDLTLGPTLSFKDYALQLLGRLFDRLLEIQGRRIMVLGATSGDTGSAAIEACRDRSAIDIVILYPQGRVSDIQRRQMTTVNSPNVQAVAVEGTFDDCQDLVKAAFAESALRHRFALAAVNSINWARIMAQVAYYLWVGHRLGHAVDFYVPTGNFGNVLAGWAARRMGGPVGRLVVANNHNHGLTRLISEGVLAIGEVRPTLAPAMDIQIPSNLERYLFELGSRQGQWMSAMMNDYREHGVLRLGDEMHKRLGRDFAAGWLSDEGIVEVIARAYRAHGILLDPHSALGWAMVERQAEPSRSAVSVATAHPAKFPEAVIEAVGFAPALPAHLADISERSERTTVISASLPELVALLERTKRQSG